MSTETAAVKQQTNEEKKYHVRYLLWNKEEKSVVSRIIFMRPRLTG
jgi:hypothetical protein